MTYGVGSGLAVVPADHMRIIVASALIIPLAIIVARSLTRRKRRQFDLGVVSDNWMAQQRGRESPQE
jgi:hypothetical protein